MKNKLALFVTVIAVTLFGVGCASPEPAFLKDGLVAYYPFNGNAHDESGNKNNGEVQGSIFRDGKAQFDGNDYILMNIELLPQGQSPRTLSFWAQAEKPDTFTMDLVCWGEPVVWQTFGGYVARGNFWFHGWSIGGGADFQVAPSNGAYLHHCISFDGEIVKYYLDSIEKSSHKRDQLDTKGTKLFVGSRADLRYKLKGTIDNIRIYNRVLSAKEIKALYEIEKPKNTIDGSE